MKSETLEKMPLTLSALPKNPWWGKGTPAYNNNPFMKLGAVPDQDKVIKEYRALLKLLERETEVRILPFAENLDDNQFYCHDYVFTRDSFISNLHGEVMVSNFSERRREPEARSRQQQLQGLGYKVSTLPEKAFAEGGEFLYADQDGILFAGRSRNNAQGNQRVSRWLGVKELFEVISVGYHLDTAMAVVKDKSGHVVAVLACLDKIANRTELMEFLQAKKIILIAVDKWDSLGSDHLGNLAINCLSLPGVLIGGSRFTTKDVEPKLKALGIKYLVTSVSQFTQFSGGSIHCLTNEL